MDQTLIIWAAPLEHIRIFVLSVMFFGLCMGAQGSPSSKAPLRAPGSPGWVCGPLPAAVPGGTASTICWQVEACPAAGGNTSGCLPKPQCNGLCVNAVTRRRSACCPFLLLIPFIPLRCAQVGGCSAAGLLLLQPMPREAAPVDWEDISSPHSRGAEPPEQCQHCLLLWETTSCQGRNLAGLQTSTRAVGISFQRLLVWVCLLFVVVAFFFLEVIYFQVWSIRAISRQEIFLFVFHFYQDSEKLTLETQSKHPPLVSVSGQ